MASKRSYTVPVLLVIITVMAVFLVLAYSKLLLHQQQQTKEAGQRLAERYNYALMFADRLQQGTDLLLQSEEMKDRLKAKSLLGEAAGTAGETLGILADASRRSGGLSEEEALKPLSEAVTQLMGSPSGSLYVVGEHDGPLTADEQRMLNVVRDGAAQMQQQLKQFRPPTGEAGFRTMNAGEAWVEHALAAGKTLVDTAAKLK